MNKEQERGKFLYHTSCDKCGSMWKDIEGYEGLYKISDKGEIKRLGYTTEKWNGFLVCSHKYSEKLLTPTKDSSGYLQIDLYKNKKRKSFKLHRLLAITFIKNPNEFKYINHKDGDKLNNLLDNLEWCTHQQNIIHSFDTGLNLSYGERHPFSKLSNANIKEIIDLLDNSDFTQKQIAIKYGVDPSQISRINTRKIWKRVQENFYSTKTVLAVEAQTH